MSQNRYQARWLGPADARVTYTLARLRRSDLTLKEWSESLHRSIGKRTGVRMIGVFNQSGCVIALMRTMGIDVEMVAGPPPLLADREALADAARQLLKVSEPA
jgi:hypothetical protein